MMDKSREELAMIRSGEDRASEIMECFARIEAEPRWVCPGCQFENSKTIRCRCDEGLDRPDAIC